MNASTARLLRDFFPDDQKEQLNKLILPEVAIDLYRTAYLNWEKATAQKLAYAPDSFFEYGTDDIHSVPADDRIFTQIAVIGGILKEWLTPPLVSYYRELDVAVQRGGRSLARRQIALWRMLEPLIDHYSSGLIEPGWHELTDAEKIDYVKASVKREVILLRGSSPLMRAAEIIKPTRRSPKAKVLKKAHSIAERELRQPTTRASKAHG